MSVLFALYVSYGHVRFATFAPPSLFHLAWMPWSCMNLGFNHRTLQSPARVGSTYPSTCVWLSPVLNTGAFFYDYLLTLPDEIQLVWRSSFNLASFLYLVIRYGAFADITMSLLLVANPPGTAGVVMTDKRYILSSVLQNSEVMYDTLLFSCTNVHNVSTVIQMIVFAAVSGAYSIQIQPKSP